MSSGVAHAVAPARHGVLPRTVFLLTLTATLLLQGAWMLALPAFHGMDEIDHVYKAASVARGELLPSSTPEDGRGGVLTVPAELVTAAGDVCESYTYMKRDNCRAMTAPTDGTVQIASAAAAYNPVYYAVVGTMARAFDGAAYNHVLRALSGVACALLLAWGAAVTARWSRDAWPLASYALAATPTLVYSSVVAAPNGLEYTSALLAWASGIALVRTRASWPLVPFTAAASLMVIMHSTGLIWLTVIVSALLVLRPLREWRQVLVEHRRAVVATAAVVAVVGAACVAWVLAADTNSPAHDEGDGPGHAPSVTTVLIQNILWPLQAVAAFPMRDQSAPTFVYAVLLLPLIAVAVIGWRAAGARTRTAIALVLAASVILPSVATFLTYGQLGTAWQGRYSLPLYVGVPLLAAHALTGRRALRMPYRVVLLGLMSLGAAVSVAHVARVVVVSRPGTSAAEALPLGWLLAAAIAGLGVLAMAPVLRHPPGNEGSGPTTATTQRGEARHPTAAIS